MRVKKIELYNITCQHCGCQYSMTSEEYKKYLKETEDFGNEIITTELMTGEREETELERYCMRCPECGGYVPLNLSPIDADRYGFNVPSNVSPVYGSSYEISMEDYLKNLTSENDEE